MKARGSLWRSDRTHTSVGQVAYDGPGWLQILDTFLKKSVFLVFGTGWFQNVPHRIGKGD